MKRVFQNLNYVAVVLCILGFALLQSYGRGYLPGIFILLVGFIFLVVYFFANISRFREKNSRMNFIFASNILIIIILNIAIVAAVNYLGSIVHKRFDFSEGGVHSLSPQSVKVIKNLQNDLNIKAFFTRENPSASAFDSLMEIYSYYSDRIKVERVDPDTNPSAVKTFGITTDGTVVFKFGKREIRVGEVSEEAITSAIIKITREKQKVVYFLQGHGEPDTDKETDNDFSIVKSSLEQMFFRIKEVILLQESDIPEDASILVVAGPQKSLFEKEIRMIENFIFQQNGNVFFLINPGEGEELKPLLKRLGVLLEDHVIVDTVSTVMGGDYFIPVVAQYPEHEITRNFAYVTFFPLCRSVSSVSPVPENIQVTVLASTSPNSWGERNYEREIQTERIAKNPEDKAGPLDIITAIEVSKNGKIQSKVVVSGDSDFVSNKYYYFSANGNLFNNIISWLADEGDLIAISPRTESPSMVTLTGSQSQLFFFYTVVILPLLVFIAGIGVWLYRRKL